MSRQVTLVTGEWTDLPLEDSEPIQQPLTPNPSPRKRGEGSRFSDRLLASKAGAWGYDGLELVCRNGYIDVDRAASDGNDCRQRLDLLARNGLKCFALSNHVAPRGSPEPCSDMRKPGMARESHVTATTFHPLENRSEVRTP
jgi:hypothetical protein